MSDRLQVEGGGDLSLLQGNGWALARGGLRFQVIQPPEDQPGLALDLELGAGGGLGGSLDCDESHSEDAFSFDGPLCEDVRMDDLSWVDRTAYGGYLGAGLGYNWESISIAWRVRLAASSATNIPATLWFTLAGGMEFRVTPHIGILIASGFQYFENRLDGGLGIYGETGMTLHF